MITSPILSYATRLATILKPISTSYENGIATQSFLAIFHKTGLVSGIYQARIADIRFYT